MAALLLQEARLLSLKSGLSAIFVARYEIVLANYAKCHYDTAWRLVHIADEYADRPNEDGA